MVVEKVDRAREVFLHEGLEGETDNDNDLGETTAERADAALGALIFGMTIQFTVFERRTMQSGRGRLAQHLQRAAGQRHSRVE
jgi:hypothetical protein